MPINGFNDKLSLLVCSSLAYMDAHATDNKAGGGDACTLLLHTFHEGCSLLLPIGIRHYGVLGRVGISVFDEERNSFIALPVVEEFSILHCRDDFHLCHMHVFFRFLSNHEAFSCSMAG